MGLFLFRPRIRRRILRSIASALVMTIVSALAISRGRGNQAPLGASISFLNDISKKFPTPKKTGSEKSVRVTENSVPLWKTDLSENSAEDYLSIGRDFIKKKDYKNAMLYLERAANQGSVPAMLALGDQYKRGLGMPRDDVKAFEWFTAAAAKENPVALLEIGNYYDSGKGGVAKSYEHAREYFGKAAAKGNSVAMYRLGVYYREGQGVAKDALAAIKWFSAAAEQKHRWAPHAIAEIYVLGNGVDVNFAEARRWYEKAAASNDIDAKWLLSRLPAKEAFHLEDYEKAARLQRTLAQTTKKEETKFDGRPGPKTAIEFGTLAYYELFARHFEAALKASEQATLLEHDQIWVAVYGVHALMFLGRADEARAAYRDGLTAYQEPLNPEYWREKVLEDFAEFEKRGLTHPQIAEIRQLLTTPAR
jgi:hypothetical protein